MFKSIDHVATRFPRNLFYWTDAKGRIGFKDERYYYWYLRDKVKCGWVLDGRTEALPTNAVKHTIPKVIQASET